MKDDNLRKIYEHYWLHARHQETQRLSFTNIYVLIVVGVFAYLGYIENYMIKVSLLTFLTILSLFGYLMTHSWNIPFVIYSRLAEEIAICEWNLPEKYQRFSKSKKGYKFHKSIGFWKISMRVSIARLFMAFYSLMIGIFGALTYQIIYNSHGCRIILIVVILFTTFYLYYLWWEQKTTNRIQSDFEKRIENDVKKI